MTGIRSSLVGRYEKKFCEPADTLPYVQVGDALGCNFTPNNNWQKFNSIGTKFRTGSSAGRFTGTFSINTILDYANLWILAMGLEKYTFDSGIHTFEKKDGMRPRSAEFRQKILNKMVDGDEDITRIYQGCVAKSISFSQDAQSGSTLAVTINGDYAWQYDVWGDLDATDWEPYDADKIEWNCLEVPTGHKIANVESVSFGITNNTELQYNTCSRKASGYFEKAVTFQAGASIYANTTEWISRLYSGGVDNTATEPWKKNLKPIPYMAIVSDSDDPLANYCKVLMEKVSVESMALEAKANTKMVDKPTLSPRKFSMEIKSGIGDLTSQLYPM